MEYTDQQQRNQTDEHNYDFSYVSTPARIACYDTFTTAPRITEINPNTTTEYIEKLTTTIYEQSHFMGGNIPYTTIREVSENFIHAHFSEIIVSIYDHGNTIRFADQGPGIPEKEKAQMPGFSSAIEPMKKYIRGVGSGLPLVREFLNSSHGSITIEDNIHSGAVVTISLNNTPLYNTSQQPASQHASYPLLTNRQQLIVKTLVQQGVLGVSNISKITNIPLSSCSNELTKLQELHIVEMVGKKRRLTDYGEEIGRVLNK